MEWGRERVGIPGRAQARAAEGGVQLCLHLSFHRRDKTGPKEAAREPGQPQTQEGWVGLHDLRAPCTCPASAASKMSGVTAHSPGKNSPGAGGMSGRPGLWRDCLAPLPCRATTCSPERASDLPKVTEPWPLSPPAALWTPVGAARLGQVIQQLYPRPHPSRS